MPRAYGSVSILGALRMGPIPFIMSYDIIIRKKKKNIETILATVRSTIGVVNSTQEISRKEIRRRWLDLQTISGASKGLSLN